MALLQELGITLPSPAYLIGVLIFGVLGIVLFWMGKRRRKTRVKWIGLALMLYPYVVWGTLAVYAVGTALSLAAWWYWNRADGRQ